MKKVLSLSMLFLLLFSLCVPVSSITIKEPQLEINAKSAVLIDANTGTVLYSLNKDTPLPPASVTKIMTLLLVFETIENGNLKYDDVLTVSEYAASMGGSQVFLEPGETMEVEELLKCVIIASANDAALTLAEHIAGSEEAFVDMMNKRAYELKMKNTHFENVTGLDDDVTDHLTTAYDIALMSRELIKHKKVSEYATIWMDTIRDGEFGLTNTNRLVRFYKGITGLKTGSTSKAGFCVSATAKRDGLELIAVIMGAESSNIRNACATKLLDYGFANYSIYQNTGADLGTIKVLGGTKDNVAIKFDSYNSLENKGNENKITYETNINENIEAPVKKGDVVGEVKYILNGEIIGKSDIYCIENIDKISFWEFFIRILENFILKWYFFNKKVLKFSDRCCIILNIII